MAATSTYDLYRKLAEERPAKAQRYRRSIVETLSHDNIHEIERDRLEEALAGIAAGFAEHPVCDRCGRGLENPESIALGIGPECRKVSVPA